MENDKIDLRNLSDEDLLKMTGLIAKRTLLVHDRLKELFNEEEESDLLDDTTEEE